MTKSKKIILLVFIGLLIFWFIFIKFLDIEEYVVNNNYIVVRTWLFLGGNPNRLLPYDNSLLYIATGPKGGLEVAKVLVDAGADVNKGQAKFTPLMNAASWGAYDIVQFLLDHGADPNLKNEMGKNALQEADYDAWTRYTLEKVTSKDTSVKTSKSQPVSK